MCTTFINQYNILSVNSIIPQISVSDLSLLLIEIRQCLYTFFHSSMNCPHRWCNVVVYHTGGTQQLGAHKVTKLNLIQDEVLYTIPHKYDSTHCKLRTDDLAQNSLYTK
jgi:hypothetical protein